MEILGSQRGKPGPQAASALSLQRLGCVHPGGSRWHVPERGWRQHRLLGSELRKGIRKVFLTVCDSKPRLRSCQQRSEVSPWLLTVDCPWGDAGGGGTLGEIRFPVTGVSGRSDST